MNPDLFDSYSIWRQNMIKQCGGYDWRQAMIKQCSDHVYEIYNIANSIEAVCEYLSICKKTPFQPCGIDIKEYLLADEASPLSLEEKIYLATYQL